MYELLTNGMWIGIFGFAISVVRLYTNAKDKSQLLWAFLLIISIALVSAGWSVLDSERIATYTALISSEPLTSINEDADGRIIFSMLNEAVGDLGEVHISRTDESVGYTKRENSEIIVLNNNDAELRREYYHKKTIYSIKFLGKRYFKTDSSYYYRYYVPKSYVESVSDYNLYDFDWSDLFAVCG
ncbi:hypothetical protein IJH66_00945 [Candidatus Saccharibacteria bacterium]|nr:hypothetical protein [Candidatus Saccharibacteria bacterium]